MTFNCLPRKLRRHAIQGLLLAGCLDGGGGTETETEAEGEEETAAVTEETMGDVGAGETMGAEE